jgi:hypothetical protein
MINLRSVNALRGLLRFTQMQTFASPLVANNYFAFAFMQLFERNKRPQELDPIFKRETKMKGHIKSKAIKVHSPKLNENPRKQKQKLKNHKGLLKRIKIVHLAIVRSALDGTECSNSSPQAPGISTDTKAEPISSGREGQDTCTKPIWTRLRNWCPTSRESHSSRDTDLYTQLDCHHLLHNHQPLLPCRLLLLLSIDLLHLVLDVDGMIFGLIAERV